jgi:glycosyltransferase involved in cell wall biosynthesis
MISLIIPSYNGARKLASLLNSIYHQSLKPDEVIVVLDGSTDNSYEIIEDWRARIKNLSLIHQENGGRSSARNSGVRESIGDLLIFVDDDIRLQKDTISNHFKFTKMKGESILFGPAYVDPSHPLANRFIKTRRLNEDKWMRKFPKGVTHITLGNYCFTTQNMSVSRRVFEKVGCFDVNLKDSEDFDFSFRAMRVGVPIYIDKDNWVWHDDYVTVKGYIIRQLEYLIARKKLKTDKPHYNELAPEHFVFPTCRLTPATCVERLVSLNFLFHIFWAISERQFINEKLAQMTMNYLVHAAVSTRYRSYIRNQTVDSQG